VPEDLTDERTEVGQVGSALNTLLVHVENSLAERHRSEQQVRQFVADASHELRTPLTTIAGYTELARRRPDDTGAVRTALGKVEEESARMTAMVEDLLLLARLDSGRPVDRQPVDLSRLLVETVSDARVVAPDHKWKLEVPEESIEVTGDVQRLHQVVTNLLTNARKYTPAGTTVTVTARPDGFSVHDDGPGFPPGLADQAFERFARGDASRTRGEQGGVGLGLALVKAIVTAHGGRVSLRSRPGSTEVTVSLPR
jgi:two-component system OmpR family sensor kinase